jgi:VIT1/CCC1 family predicted Fe2+/Mn2+ transporter
VRNLQEMKVHRILALLLGCHIMVNMLFEYFQVHHGGAGTTSAGLKAAVIFFSYLLSVLFSTLPYFIWTDAELLR